MSSITKSGFPDPRRILVVCPSWIGDMVMAQSLFKTLRARLPEVTIDALAAPWSLPLLDCMPEISQAIALPVAHGELKLGVRREIAKELSQKNYDQAILLPNSFKSALIPWLAGIPRRTGWLGEMRFGLLNDFRRLDKIKLGMTVQRFVALAGDGEDVVECPAPHFQVNAVSVKQTLAELELNGDNKKVLVLCPGAEYGPSKRWSAERFGWLAAQWIRAGGQAWLLGSEKDRQTCRQVKQIAGEWCLDLSGQTSLGQAVDLISLADGVVSNDSGLMHVAAALNRPLVAIYGSSDPGFTPPLNNRHRILSAAMDCSPCFTRECPKNTNACLKEISAQQAYGALNNLLGVKE